MSWRTVKPNPEDRLDSFNDAFKYGNRNVPEPVKTGVCGCGVSTNRYVTHGAPGDPRNRWQCEPCAEIELREQFMDRR